MWITLGSVAGYSCGRLVAAIDAAPIGKTLQMTNQGNTYFLEKSEMLAWVSGFLTGINLSQPTPAKQIVADGPAIELALKNYCEAKPTDTVVDAAESFAKTNLRAQ